MYTSKPFVDACLRTKTHYLDITGEYKVFEEVLSRNVEAMNAGIVLLPGIGMDVVPTDCLASKLKATLPSATHLQMALFPHGAEISPGTMKTVLLSLTEPSKIRKDGQIADATRQELTWNNPDMGEVRTRVLTWGDITSAYHSTNIPNISVYVMATPDQEILNTWKGTALKWMAAWGPTRWVLNKGIERYVHGPTEGLRNQGRVFYSGVVWEEKTNQMAECSLTTVEGYRLTAHSMIKAVHKLSTTHSGLSGALTPSQAFGTDYVMEFDHSKWGDVTVRTGTHDEFAARM